MKRLLISFVLFIIFLHTSYANVNLGTIVVSPNRSVEDFSKVGSSVIVIEKENIENSTYNNTTGILQEFGGFTVAPKGNRGSDPGYYLRGLSRKYIRVLIDGIDMSDITSVAEEPTYLDNINLNNIKSIEILNGSQGTLYGSNAIGGVISIDSLNADEKGAANEIFLEAGSYGSIKNSNTFKYLNNKTNFSINVNGERSNGYSSFVDNSLSNYEKDGFYLYGSSIVSEYKLNKSLALKINARFYNQANEHDDAYSYPADSLLHYRQDKAYGALFSLTINNNNSKHEIKFQPTYTTRINSTGSVFEYDGRRQKLEYLIYNKLINNIDNLSGIEYMKLDADISGAVSQKEVYAIFSELRFPIMSNTNLDFSLRREFDSYYDIFDTGRLQLNHKIFNNVLLKSNIGTGYRAPAASELFDPTYGNTDLKPEKSLSYGLGFEYYVPKLLLEYSVNFFETVVEDIITAPAPTYISQQSIESLKTKGLETSLEKELFQNHLLKFSYARILGKQEDGDSITLVPKNKFITSINTKISKRLTLNSNYIFHNKSRDTKYNKLPAYKSLNLNVNYKIDKDRKAFLKIQNALDRENITNRGGGTTQNQGYRNPERSFFIGLKLNY